MFVESITDLISQLPFMDDKRALLVVGAFLPIMKAAFVYTVPLAFLSFALGLVIAVAVALVRIWPSGGRLHWLLLKIVRFYVSAIIGFSLNVGAYASETIRAAILSVPKGQWEAGFTIGMTYMHSFRRIILPQAFRVAVPPLSNSFIDLFKSTSLASTITITELFRTAQQIANANYDFLPVYILAALIYWLFCFVFFIIQERIERRLERSVAR